MLNGFTALVEESLEALVIDTEISRSQYRRTRQRAVVRGSCDGMTETLSIIGLTEEEPKLEICTHPLPYRLKQDRCGLGLFKSKVNPVLPPLKTVEEVDVTDYR